MPPPLESEGAWGYLFNSLANRVWQKGYHANLQAMKTSSLHFLILGLP